MIKIFNLEKDILKFDFNYNLKETNSINEIFSQVRKGDKLQITDLRRVALWKIDRVLDIPHNVLEELDKLSKDKKIKDIFTEDIKKILNDLTDCDGVGFPMASSILKFLRPDLFPIIDKRAYRALYGKTLHQYQYSTDKYFEYAKKIYEIRDKKNIELSKIDEQLYMFDKINNKDSKL